MHLCFNPPASSACLVKSSLVMNGLSVVFLLVLSKLELIMSMGRRIMVVAAVAAGRWPQLGHLLRRRPLAGAEVIRPQAMGNRPSFEKKKTGITKWCISRDSLSIICINSLYDYVLYLNIYINICMIYKLQMSLVYYMRNCASFVKRRGHRSHRSATGQREWFPLCSWNFWASNADSDRCRASLELEPVPAVSLSRSASAWDCHGFMPIVMSV